MGIDEIAPDVDIEKELAAETAAETPAAETETPKETPKEAQKEAPKEQKMVPLDALHESRMKERESRARAEQIERESADRFQKLEKRLELLANPPPKVPAFEEDPANHLRHGVEQVRQEIEPVRKDLDQFKRDQQQFQAIQEISARTQAMEAEFVKQTPDYAEAVNFLKNMNDRNLQLLGMDDPVQRAQQVHNQSLAIAQRALATGKNPAEIAYQLAKNAGYAAKAKADDPDKKIESIERGQKATAPMPSGGKKETPISLSALEAMDDDEFNKLVDDPVQWKKLISQA